MAVTPFAFVSTGFLSFCQTASTGSAAALIAAVSSSGFPVSTVASFSGVEKTGVGTAPKSYTQKRSLHALKFLKLGRYQKNGELIIVF